MSIQTQHFHDTDERHPGHAPHSVPAIRPHPAKLIAVTAVFNPHRFHSRYRLFRAFKKQMHDAGISLIVVEIAMGHRPFEVTQSHDPHDIQLVTHEEIWQKERALNIGIERAIQLYPDAQFLAWIDADITFARSDIANETLHKLEHYPVVQMFSQAVNLGPHEEIMWTCPGFSKSFESQKNPTDFTGKSSPYYAPGGHPGLCWAFQRKALDAMGVLFDMGIAGSGDLHMAAAWIGKPQIGTHAGRLSPAYKRSLDIWGQRADDVVKRNIGYVDGACFHHWHGKSTQRGYALRWEILYKYNFDPFVDIFKDTQGLWRISQAKRAMAIELKNSLNARNEDSIDQ